MGRHRQASLLALAATTTIASAQSLGPFGAFIRNFADGSTPPVPLYVGTSLQFHPAPYLAVNGSRNVNDALLFEIVGTNLTTADQKHVFIAVLEPGTANYTMRAVRAPWNGQYPNHHASLLACEFFTDQNYEVICGVGSLEQYTPFYAANVTGLPLTLYLGNNIPPKYTALQVFPQAPQSS